MLLLFVQIRVKPEFLDAFRAVTLENARNSRLESECLRFDIVQEVDEPTRFALVEVYRSPEGHAVHRETAHFKAWAAAAEPMMAEPRTRIRYSVVSPAESEW